MVMKLLIFTIKKLISWTLINTCLGVINVPFVLREYEKYY